MSDLAISVENLGKLYHIGTRQERYKTLRDSLVNAVVEPIRRFGKSNGGDRNQDTLWALKDVSFEVRQGEVVGIIGRNGAGKSTLLKILSHITEPTEGRVRLRGRVGSLLEVGTGFHAELTGRENIYLNGAILGMKKTEIERKFDEIVAFSEIEKFLDTPVKRYSSGMYVRLAFAVAAHLEPEILMVDEVLAVGDGEFQKKCLGKMEDVAKQGRTVLFVSHSMNAIDKLCTRGMLLERGELKLNSDDVDRVIKNYLFGGENEAIVTEWRNSGGEFANPWFKPISFAIMDENGNKLDMPVRNDTNIWVQLEGQVEILDPALTIGYAIYAEDGSLLYWSYHTDGGERTTPKLQPGHCIIRSRLPERFLNEGTYRLELIGGLHFREWLFPPGVHAPSVDLSIRGGLSDSSVWIGRRPGLLAPVMEWR